jgi:hypothetical protein
MLIGKLPVVKCGAYIVSELEGIVQLAQAKGVSLTDYLNAAERADLRAYMSLVHNVLGNALLYVTWLDEEVYKNFTRHRVGSPYNFPLKFLLPWTFRRRVKAQLTALKWAFRTPQEVYREGDTTQFIQEQMDEHAGKIHFITSFLFLLQLRPVYWHSASDSRTRNTFSAIPQPSWMHLSSAIYSP